MTNLIWVRECSFINDLFLCSSTIFFTIHCVYLFSCKRNFQHWILSSLVPTLIIYFSNSHFSIVFNLICHFPNCCFLEVSSSKTRMNFFCPIFFHHITFLHLTNLTSLELHPPPHCPFTSNSSAIGPNIILFFISYV